MILANKYRNPLNVIIGLLLVTMLFSCVQKTNFPAGKKITCDAETVTKNSRKLIAVNDSSEFFGGGKLISDIDANSGNHSVLTVPKTKAFAFEYVINNAGPDAYFKVSVWRKSKDGLGALVASGDNNKVLYLATSEPVEINDNGWAKLEMEVYTPPHFGRGVLTFYVWNNSTDTVYFDDFTIERNLHKQYPQYDYEAGLNIVLDSSDFLKIMKKRRQAFKNGILQTSDNDWVKGIVVDDDRAMKSKFRLKGDWLDHLWGDKWSYRVKMRMNNTFDRLRTFSLQTPASRSFLLEWLTHKLYQKNDVLTTRYGFVPLQFNNEPRGIYAWEEHFVKQLLEWNQRREGPIVKFSEDPFWQIQKVSLNSKNWPNFPFYQAATIVPFSTSRTVKDTKLYHQFLNAQKLMYQYKNRIKTSSEIFDIDKLAKYYAMLELTHARHGMVWHNQRMYYNSVICKLEPIAFDGYTDHDDLDLTITDNVVYRALTHEEPLILQDLLIYNLFVDTVFLNLYMHYLEKYSQPDFINNFMNSTALEASYYDSLLRMEFPHYHYNDSLLSESAEAIRNYIPALEKIIYDSLISDNFDFRINDEVFTDTSVFENTPEFFVNVYTEAKNADTAKLSIYNYFARNLVFLGTGEGSKLITDYFTNEATLKAYSSGMEGQMRNLVVDTSANYLFFMINGRMDSYSVPIMPWPYPAGITPQQELWQLVDLNNEVFDRVSGNTIFLKKGDITIKEPLIIPDGFILIISEGTKIDITDSAMIISYSPVQIIGTYKDPVIVTSSDFTGNGFTVLQANGKSKLDYVVFENLNTLNFKHWTLTGAVTFYESDVTITNTKFYRNQCEDALNIIRSNFTISNSSFDYIYGDAFDGDFCIGKVESTTFTNINNDAMDFSGSIIVIKDSEVYSAKDKGISGGEDSQIFVINTKIKNSNIGIASKDLSRVEVSNSKIITCNYGVVLLQKKPEYGPSVMIIKNTLIQNSKVDMLIEENSSVDIDNRIIFGKEKNLSKIFY